MRASWAARAVAPRSSRPTPIAAPMRSPFGSTPTACSLRVWTSVAAGRPAEFQRIQSPENRAVVRPVGRRDAHGGARAPGDAQVCVCCNWSRPHCGSPMPSKASVRSTLRAHTCRPLCIGLPGRVKILSVSMPRSGTASRNLSTNVRSIRVDRVDEHRLLRFVLEDRQGIQLPAGSLSDGTLRFVALAIMERDPQATGVLCLEGAGEWHSSRSHECHDRSALGHDRRHIRHGGRRERPATDRAQHPLTAGRRLGGRRRLDLCPGTEGPSRRAPAHRHRDLPLCPAVWRTDLGAPPLPLGEIMRYLGALWVQPNAGNGRRLVWTEYADQLLLPHFSADS